MIFVALLRGVNVGGNNKVEMKKLKTTFESSGFTNVVTYINSGNIIFEASSTENYVIADEIEKAIKRDFQLEIKVLIRNLPEMETIFRELPESWVKNEKMRTDVMFLWDQFDKPEILENLHINLVDHVKYVTGAILWNVESVNYSKSGMLKLVGTALYRNMTIRNVNTFRKIFQIMTSI
jgi:uncharacterized protein (DUF1697 family)